MLGADALSQSNLFHAEMPAPMKTADSRFMFVFGLVACGLLLVLPRFACAEITPARVFSDNIVLQRDVPFAVWGTSTAETKVTVEFANQVKSCTPEKDGSWLVRLDPVAASGEPRELVIRGATATTIKNVLVGDVWIYAGGAEANRPATGDIKLPEAGLPQARIFAISEATSRQVEADTKATWAVVGTQNLNRLPGLAVCLGQAFGSRAEKPPGHPAGGRCSPEGCDTTIRDEIPPRGVKWATSVIRRGFSTATRSSRIRLVTFS